MSKNKELADYIMDQLSDLGNVRNIPMMGGFIFYYKERIFGGIYGNGFLVKITEASKKFMPDSEPEPPYEGAKLEELENENAELREELEYYKNRKLSGRQKHNAKWMAIYNDFVDCYENGMTMIEIARRNNVSERTIYRYKAYYDKMRKVEVDE